MDDMPVFPGKRQPSFSDIAWLASDRYREKHLSLDSHVGTHIDAPAHMLQPGKTLDQFPVSKFMGTATVIKIPTASKVISKKFLSDYRNEIGASDYVLFNTGWHVRWGTPEYMVDFPVLDEEGADWISSFPLKGIGIDTISVDPTESVDWPVHFILFSREIVIVENLSFPESIPVRGKFCCFPLKIDKADGSPVRAVFIQE